MDSLAACMYETRMAQPYRAASIRISQYYVPDARIRGGLTTVLRAGWLDALPGGGIRRDECPGDDVLYCLSGRGQVETDGLGFDLTAGQLAWIAGDKPHGHCADRRDPWSVMWLRLDGPDLGTLRERIFGAGRSRMTISEGSELIGWFQSLFQILETQRVDTDLRLNAAVAAFLQILGRQREPRAHAGVPAPLERLRHMIAANPERAWLADDMADVAGVSPSQLRRLFRQYLNTTPRAHLRHQRLAMAQRMMLESSLSLQEIAIACGFCDGYHFSRDFRRVVGRSPTDWRKSELGMRSA
ncbi:AraC family transcriptional regulator [Roseitalea porphyridii]|uniref:AraC family transcriptional regulator n=2 Tax=Roseitalea porphyridii TaxID=1852022 RepID=A0A4P6V3K4_9HYPH|nr:AraC family transcriptional regulator [Roseitalea porphyridii]